MTQTSDILTREEHLILSDATETEGTVCAIISLLSGLCSAAWLLAGHWEGLAGLAVAAMLLTVANDSFTQADRHHSAAHSEAAQ